MIEVSLVCGFLGAGKTTWLSRRLRQGADIDVVVVNDFATEGVDGRLLAQAAGEGSDVIAIDGGCVCCDRLDELGRVLRTVVDRTHGAGGDSARVWRVVIETSGLAQPGPVLELLTSDPVLSVNTRLREVVVLVDGVDGGRLLRHQPAVRAHVRLADRVVLTRSDLVDPEALDELATLVMDLQPSARVTWSAHGDETTCALPRTPTKPSEWHDHDDELRPQSWSVELSPGTSWAEYAWWLHALTRAHPDRILRSKGIVLTADGPVLVQTIGPVVAAPVRVSEAPVSAMTFITDGVDARLLARSLAAFVPSAVTPQ